MFDIPNFQCTSSQFNNDWQLVILRIFYSRLYILNTSEKLGSGSNILKLICILLFTEISQTTFSWIMLQLLMKLRIILNVIFAHYNLPRVVPRVTCWMSSLLQYVLYQELRDNHFSISFHFNITQRLMAPFRKRSILHLLAK